VSFALESVVPWGRPFDEYVAMFALAGSDLARRILGCGDGPASFNAEATRRGCHVVSADPIYRYTPAELGSRIAVTAPVIAAQTRQNADEFVWTHFRNVDALVQGRMTAMQAFLEDLISTDHAGRYVAAAVPHLPFADRSFDLALVSHFLFLYSAQHDAAFHVAALVELRRVATEVRVFPLLELGSVPSRHLAGVTDMLEGRGLTVERVRVDYEFQKGGDEMLRIR